MPQLSPDDWKTLMSASALIVSLCSLWISRRNWLQSNRPIISATVETYAGGNESIAYNLVVTNTGNRPAVSVRLFVSTDGAEKCMAPWVEKFKGSSTTYAHVLRCFSEKGEIPLLANGKSMTNSFGYTRGDEETFWHYGSTLRITIRYWDLDGRKYIVHQPIRIKDSEAFAGGMWKTREDES
ncbi:hypothetical protein JAB5_42990 [Janthinobacterium sp. HH103]|nr:hypothetical protein JAB2_52580 [Janthinobacterium sp. HH100]OEZ70689.1 hypothetical protein JAB5_42990 [Janthinobacterium sp. HH103]QOU70897.1 hypothetical protein JAB4_002900 [Janthinobacterium sp. HH102]